MYYNICFIFISLQDGDTALIKAAEKGHTSTMETLVHHGAAVDIQNKVASCYFALHKSQTCIKDCVCGI